MKGLDALRSILTVEYHGAELRIDASMLGDFGQLRPGKLLQFLGELEKDNGKVCHLNHGLL